MTAKKPWTIRPFAPEDKPGVQKLWAGVASFDGGVPARSAAVLDAMLAHPAHQAHRHARIRTETNSVAQLVPRGK